MKKMQNIKCKMKNVKLGYKVQKLKFGDMVVLLGIGILALLAASASAPVAAAQPTTPFMVFGWVEYSTGEPVLNPIITITNTNTSEVFSTATSASSNYYQVLTSSRNVSAGDVLHFLTTDTNDTSTAEFNHTVTQEEMNAGVFTQNITLSAPDLVPTAITTPATIYANECSIINVTVANNGTVAVGSFNVSLRANGTEVGKETVDSLNGSESKEVQFTWTPASADTYELCVVADCNGDVAESNETNNVTCRLVEVIERRPDLVVTEIEAYHNHTGCSPWFNLSNEVDITVSNIGSLDAGAFNVSLYADNEFIGKKTVPGLAVGNTTAVQLKWTPIGDDCLLPVCDFEWSYHDYNLTGVADCDSDVAEYNVTNNNLTEVERACYNGYMTDEPLENVFHGTLHGGLIFTTGDGTYGKLDPPGSYKNTTYEITLPAGASVELARLNVYYTWHEDKESCPEMEVSIDGTVVPLDVSYNDIKCHCPGADWEFPWGNYVYDITDYIQGSGTYTVTVKRKVFPPNPDFCIAAPGIVLVYEDKNAPMIEYWINEGADTLLCGRRKAGGYLALEECINNATFPGSIKLSKVKNATLGVVSPWAGSAWEPGTTNYLYFNDIELGKGVYHGYKEKYMETIGSITMEINSTDAQVGVNVTSVTAHYLKGSDNVVGQGDDGDNMMPANAFLVITYEEEEEEEEIFDTGSPVNPYPSIFGTHNGSITPNVTIHNVFKLYTYPCEGTGGHTEYVAFYYPNRTNKIAEGRWEGYASDWHNVTFPAFTMHANYTYYYTIKTGSYPQIHHTDEWKAKEGMGIINCTSFVDANGKIYNNWVPAIRLE